jgi:hypothetical protein
MDTQFTSRMLTVQMDAPYTSAALVVKRNTLCTVHIHTTRHLLVLNSSHVVEKSSRKSGKISLTFIIIFIFYNKHTFINSITFMQYMYPSPFAEASLIIIFTVSQLCQSVASAFQHRGQSGTDEFVQHVHAIE